jgi:hypothetical protein
MSSIQATLQVASVLETGAAQSTPAKKRETVRLVAPKTITDNGITIAQGTTFSFTIDDAAQMGQFKGDQMVAITLTPIAA